MKFLLVFAVLWIAYFLWRQGRRERMRDAARKPQAPRAPTAIPAPQAMLRCAHCGLHLPAAEAVTGADGLPFCSAAHAQAGPVQAP